MCHTGRKKRVASRSPRGMQEDLIIYRTAATSSRYLNSADISPNTSGATRRARSKGRLTRDVCKRTQTPKCHCYPRDSLVIFLRRGDNSFSLFRPEQHSMIYSNIKSVEGTIVDGLAIWIDSSGNGDAALQPGVKERGE